MKHFNDVDRWKVDSWDQDGLFTRRIFNKHQDAVNEIIRICRLGKHGVVAGPDPAADDDKETYSMGPDGQRELFDSTEDMRG